MKVAGTTSILTLMILLVFASERSTSQEQFHDAHFLDQLDQDIMNEKEITPIQPDETFLERERELKHSSDSKNDDTNSEEKKIVSPCFQVRRESVLTPVVEKYSKIEKIEQVVDCADTSFKNIQINEKGCYIEIFYNVPARRTVSKLQYRFKKYCCSGHKGANCDRLRDSGDDASNDMESLEDEGDKRSLQYNGIAGIKYKDDHVQMCDPSGRCICKKGWTGPLCEEAQCRFKCHNGGKCIRPDYCACPRGFAGHSCKIAIIKCNQMPIDIGFVLDSSGSLSNYYTDEKNFLVTLARVFGVSQNGAHAGVITFGSTVHFSIRLNQYRDEMSFDRAVNRIPLYRGWTRIDLALEEAFSKMFDPRHGARTNIPRLLVLITDGSQTKPGHVHAEVTNYKDPVIIADKIRKAGIKLVVIGVGSAIDKNELAKLAGSHDNWYSAGSWSTLKSRDFVHNMTGEICQHAKAVCVKPCLNKGTCMEGKCSCALNWEGDQCQIPICRASCEHGICVGPNTCKCDEGWEGAVCDKAICKLPCKNGGKCISPDRCACTSGFQGIDCEEPVCAPGCGVGTCIGPNKCLCPQGHSGSSCEIVAPTVTPGGGGRIDEDTKTCALSGRADFKTFDDKFFYFPGKCTYQVAGDCIGQSFAVHISIDPECSSLYEKPCKRFIQLFLRSDINVKIDSSGVSVNKLKQTLPFSFKNIMAKKVGDFVIVEGLKGLKIKWDGHDGVYISMAEEHKNKTCGLCGNYDGIADNDFTTYQGKVTKDVTVFGNSWSRTKIDEKCPNVFKQDLASTFEKLKYHEMREIDLLCDPLINGDEFAKCRKTINANPYFLMCREEVARCDQADRKKCVCNTFTQYSRTCARHSVVLNWRTSSLCPVVCKNGHVHNECGTACPKTCHNLLHHSTCQQSCVDGCFCPPGLVSNGTHCINEYHCSCMHEKKIYKSGEAINKDCNKCYCTRGRWKCTERECPGTCTAFGKHIKTFDGKWYDFNSVCKYMLTRDVNQLFFVILENVRCSRMNYMVDSCAKSLVVQLNSTEIKLRRDFTVIVDGVRVSMPYTGPGVTIKEASHCFLRLHASIGLDILYDRYGQKILVTVGRRFMNKTMGLCGTFNKKQEDDYMTSDGNVDTNVFTFGKSWKIDPRCRESPPTKEDPCDLQPQRGPIAEKKCNKLMTEPFAKCHKVVNPEKYIKLCKDDVCSCTDGQNCLCEVIATYVHECALSGVVIQWRNTGILPECAVKCPANQVHQECGSLCKRTCRDLATFSTCNEVCVAGCNCPNGTVMNDLGSCVVPAECTCHVDGRVHNPDDVMYKDTCTRCVCVNGQFNCTTTEHCGKTCPGNQIWTDKKVSCFKTCDNLHLPCLKSMNPVGCRCPGDTVWDSNLQKCVDDTQCPCHHNGKSYYNGETYRFGCNNCTCRNSRWKCTTFSCSGTCSAYGDPHYTTFDGKKFHFEGRCTYIVAEDHCGKPGTFRILAENVACGTTGATCSKTITITIQDTMIFLRRGEAMKVIPAFPGAIMQANYKVIKTTFFDIIHANIGITIMWDRGTRLLVSLDPKYRGRTCGLCGNFNGNQEDDFTSPEGDVGVTPEVFGDSYKIDDSCPDTKPPQNPCEAKKYRAAWSHKQCSIINSDLFKACHQVVDQKPYYEACYYDTCGCDMGGDCECLCTAVAAYAQVCNLHGVHVKWRTQKFCPIQCQTCDIYKACGTTHPETCENRCESREVLPIKCVEGCFCPNGTVRSRDGKCVKPAECQCYKDGIAYPPHSRVRVMNPNDCEEDCICKDGCMKCTFTGKCLTTTETPTTTPITTRIVSTSTSSTTPKTIHSTTHAPTTPYCPEPHKHKCVGDGKCIDAGKICDKHCDCVNCTDELHCPTTCPPCSDFKCRSDCKCISRKFVCDQHVDCPDKSDEKNCNITTTPIVSTERPTTTPCTYPLQWRCVKECEGDCHFIRQKKKCDKSSKCHFKCACPPGLFNNGTHCVAATSCGCLVDKPPLTLVPPGQSWEKDCTVYTCFNNTVTSSPKSCPTRYCRENETLVVKKGSCCPVCECFNCTVPPKPCWPGEIRCGKKCIPKPWICDGEIDCGNCTKYKCDGIHFCDECHCPTTKPPCNDKLLPKVPDDRFSASSSASIFVRPPVARINPPKPMKHDGGAWCAKRNQDGKEWIQVDLGQRMEIRKVGTKGRYATGEYVVHYRLLYSLNGYSWDVLKENGTDKWFRGNTNSDEEVINKLPTFIKARYIRLNVESYHGQACLRMELYGCGAAITTPTPVIPTTRCPEYLCDDGKTCIPHEKICDTIPDCPPKPGRNCTSDECDCSKTCRPSYHRCPEGKCIPKSYLCDGEPDCINGTDECPFIKECCKTTPVTATTKAQTPAVTILTTEEPTTTGSTTPFKPPFTFHPPTTTARRSTTIPSTITTKTTTTESIIITESTRKPTQPQHKYNTTGRPKVTFQEKTPRPTTPEKTPRPTTPEKTPRPTTPEKTPRPTTPEKTPRPTTPEKTPRPTTPEKTPRPTTPSTGPPTTHCPATCLCEVSCKSLSEDRSKCLVKTCIDKCECPRGYKRDNRTGHCFPDIHCPCVHEGRIYPPGAVIRKAPCQECICKEKGFECSKYCEISLCPKGYHIKHYDDDRCCECVPIPCPEGKTPVDCGCPVKCPDLDKKNNTVCSRKTCIKDACMCPEGTFDNGTACVQKSECQCIVDGVVHPPESTWPQDKCHDCKCVNGQTKCGKVCRLKSCPDGHELVFPDDDKDECCFCRIIPTTIATTTKLPTTQHPTTQHPTTQHPTTQHPTTQQKTTPTEMPKCSTETTKEHFVDPEGCKTEHPIEKTKCRGQCPSVTTSDIGHLKAVSDCKCCKPFEYRKTSVKLLCPKGKSKYHTYYVFKSCRCYGCSANPFGDDLNIESSDEYALRR